MSTLLTALSTAVGHVSRRSGDFILGVTRLQLNIACGQETAAQNPMSRVISQHLDMVRGTISRLKLNGQTKRYAVCPTCHCTYLPRLDRRIGLDFYPEICTNLSAPGAAQCNTQLKDGNNPKKNISVS